MFWWVVTPILAFYLKMSTGVPIDRITHHCTDLGTGELECLESYLVRRETRISDCCRLRASRAHSAVARIRAL